MEITYRGPAEYAGMASKLADQVEPEHINYYTAPSHLWTLSDGTQLHLIAYNTPKSGIKIRCWVYDHPSQNPNR